ncbi:MAG: A/G-specific adenine glycosylase [Nocardioidaceae bacterium]|nr:A/G-specific adenine glycosylase [Nocardioidaceae bacterium]
MPESPAHEPLLHWYAVHARDLPWRRPETPAWGVLVSEVMLQQTPVARVLPVYGEWLRRWPTPSALAEERPGEAVRLWGRLGYPRRALRLHQAATVIDDRHGGEVPRSYGELRALPGIGDYTAAAVSAFAFRQREVVLDTNIRRVVGRLAGGTALPPAAVTRQERTIATDLLPDEPGRAATWNVALMELGALVCTAREPRCGSCPVAGLCAWRAAGCPDPDQVPRRPQTYAGTDRQCRGRILAVLRDALGPVSLDDVRAAWDAPTQRERALASLLDDGLVVRVGEGSLGLP